MKYHDDGLDNGSDLNSSDSVSNLKLASMGWRRQGNGGVTLGFKPLGYVMLGLDAVSLAWARGHEERKRTVGMVTDRGDGAVG